MSLVIKANRFRAIIAVAVFWALLFWIVYGWDSGVDQVFNQGMYGKSLHFSAIVTYGLLFIYSSKHLESWDIAGFKNIVYSMCLTALNISLFEIIYILLFQHFQLGGILPYLMRDWLFLSQYFIVLLIGLVGALGVYYETRGEIGLKNIGPELVPSHYREALTQSFFLTWILVLGFLLWIFYPGPTETLTYGLWTSSQLFPQTHYAYVHSSLYSANFSLHGVNLAVKSLFALLQLQLLRMWTRIERK